ncbi:lytic polysaccharide monooxygenase auxiliary activity family 9 protein [Streptomyces pinistramenti]|uniref:lytic polysaccharide monooxygenase auxiliary activity family 9 protein n=1 Tax=Streptomyces pinistramenti TaxID=2884812 RepID=UPI001D097FFF|nr:lytic polysaccharide monooxygenase [Streptomyces pinistramenti]MCB5912280.1 lytic polysaccharide monooxygenase [Streptomyces pinistramenti]
MTARRKATGIALTGLAPLALTVLSAAPAAAHGSMADPVSRVSACFAEGPESPRSAACKAAVQAGGAQAFYDWNEVNIPDAGGRSKEIIPDGRLCSAGRDKYKGLDLPRADWPASPLTAGPHTFRYKATAPHKGTFQLYLTKRGYDPAKPLTWSDLESTPFAEATNPELRNGDYVFDGKVPARKGRQLVFSIWQRSDSPEAFYSCSDVVFGKDAAGRAGGAAAGAQAPTDTQIAAGTGRSTVDHHGHGGTGGTGTGTGTGHEHPAGAHKMTHDDGADNGAAPAADGNAARTDGGGARPSDGQRLAETGGDTTAAPLAIGGTAVLAAGAAFLFTANHRRAVRRRG